MLFISDFLPVNSVRLFFFCVFLRKSLENDSRPFRPCLDNHPVRLIAKSLYARVSTGSLFCLYLCLWHIWRSLVTLNYSSLPLYVVTWLMWYTCWIVVKITASVLSSCVTTMRICSFYNYKVSVDYGMLM